MRNEKDFCVVTNKFFFYIISCMTKTYNIGKFFQSEIHQQPTLEDIFPSNTESDQKSTNIKSDENLNSSKPNNNKTETATKRQAMISNKVGILKTQNNNEQLPFSLEKPKIQSSTDINVYKQCKSDENKQNTTYNEKSNQKSSTTPIKTKKETKQAQGNSTPQRKSIITEEIQNQDDIDSDSGDMFDPKKVCRTYEFPTGKSNQLSSKSSLDKLEEEDFDETSSFHSLKTGMLCKSENANTEDNDYDLEYDDSFYQEDFDNDESPKPVVKLILPDEIQSSSEEI